MKGKRKKVSGKITERDFIIANRRAARLEEIALHGKPVSLRVLRHKSKKAYSRKALKAVEPEEI